MEQSGNARAGRRLGAVAEHAASARRIGSRTTCLVVVDMQYASASRDAGLGRWLAERGRAEEGRYRFDRIERLVVPNVVRLLECFRHRGLPRVFLRVRAQTEDAAELVAPLQRFERAIGNVAGSHESEFLEEVKPLSGEPVITKLSSSAFTSSGLDAFLRNSKIKTTVFAGVSTSQCVDLTARDAADRGYESVIVEDAVAEDRPEFHEATLHQFSHFFGHVLTTEVLLEHFAHCPAVERTREAS